MAMRRLNGPLLMATGVLDILYVLVLQSRQMAAIARDGFFNSVDPGVASGRGFAYPHCRHHPALGPVVRVVKQR
jgi:hypothetical protein